MVFEPASIVPHKLKPFDKVEVALAHSSDGKALIGRGLVIDTNISNGNITALILLLRNPAQLVVRPINIVVQVPDPRDLSGRTLVDRSMPAPVELWNIEEHMFDTELRRCGAWRYFGDSITTH